MTAWLLIGAIGIIIIGVLAFTLISLRKKKTEEDVRFVVNPGTSDL
jgi:hypothetical protein